MREVKNNDNGRSTTPTPGLVVLVVLSLFLAVLFVARPTTWATPEQAPNWQLTPTPTLLPTLIPTLIPIPTPRPTGEPVPEPATILLLGGGTLGLGIYTYLAARRYRQKGGPNGSGLS